MERGGKVGMEGSRDGGKYRWREEGSRHGERRETGMERGGKVGMEEVIMEESRNGERREGRETRCMGIRGKMHERIKGRKNVRKKKNIGGKKERNGWNGQRREKGI